MLHPVLEVNRASLGDVRLVDDAPVPLGDQEVRLRIDRFAITANNVTYGVFGDVLGYWDFFPTDPPWGRVPAMGWAEVIESNSPDIEAGSRYYGWYPMAAETTIRATATADGFRDDGDHRQRHAPIYRAYTDTRHDALYDAAPDGEDRHALLRGLFLTGFLAEEFFADPGSGSAPYFGAHQAIVLSASSKTAIGFAQRAKDRGAAAVVGVTSERNAEFVSGLGYYDTVLTYDALDDLDASRDAVSIDMAGNPAVLSAIHHRLGDRLKYSMTVGRSHHDAPAPGCRTDGWAQARDVLRAHRRQESDAGVGTGRFRAACCRRTGGIRCGQPFVVDGGAPRRPRGNRVGVERRVQRCRSAQRRARRNAPRLRTRLVRAPEHRGRRSVTARLLGTLPLSRCSGPMWSTKDPEKQECHQEDGSSRLQVDRCR